MGFRRLCNDQGSDCASAASLDAHDVDGVADDIGTGFLSLGSRAGHHSPSTRTPATMTLYSETENDWPLGVIILTALRPSNSAFSSTTG